MKNRRHHVAFDTVIITVFFGIIIFLSYVIHGSFSQEFGYTCLIGIFGLSVGSLVGIYMSPFSNQEKREFSKLQVSVLGFITGFVACKVEPGITELLQVGIFTDPITRSRVLIFTICLTFSSIYMYVYRKYYIEEDLGRAGEREN